jgi:hypothetical protein
VTPDWCSCGAAIYRLYSGQIECAHRMDCPRRPGAAPAPSAEVTRTASPFDALSDADVRAGVRAQLVAQRRRDGSLGDRQARLLATLDRLDRLDPSTPAGQEYERGEVDRARREVQRARHNADTRMIGRLRARTEQARERNRRRDDVTQWAVVNAAGWGRQSPPMADGMGGYA